MVVMNKVSHLGACPCPSAPLRSVPALAGTALWSKGRGKPYPER